MNMKIKQNDHNKFNLEAKREILEKKFEKYFKYCLLLYKSPFTAKQFFKAKFKVYSRF